MNTAKILRGCTWKIQTAFIFSLFAIGIDICLNINTF